MKFKGKLIKERQGSTNWNTFQWKLNESSMKKKLKIWIIPNTYRLSVFQLQCFLNNCKAKKSAQFHFPKIIPHKYRYFKRIKFCLKKKKWVKAFQQIWRHSSIIFLCLHMSSWTTEKSYHEDKIVNSWYETLTFSLASKINVDALRYELVIAS